MKLAFIVDVINEKSGARAPIQIIVGLCRLREEITVFSYRTDLDPQVATKLKKAGAKLVFIDSPKGRIGKYFTAVRLIKPLREGNFDLISCHSSLPFFYAAKRVGKPIVYTYYGTQLTSYNNKLINETSLKVSLKERIKYYLLDKAILFLEGRRIWAASRVVAISKSTALEVSDLYHKKIDYIYLGAGLQPTRNTRKQKRQDLIMLSVSRIVPYKGFHRLLTAFKTINKEVPEAKLVIIGTNHHPPYLNYLMSLKPKNTEILLSVTDEVLRDYYQKADLYVSETTWEGFGLPFLEAQNYGKPVVGFNNTSIPEVLVDGTTGFLVNSQKEFVEKIVVLLKNKTLREKMGNQAALFAKKFNWRQCAKEYQRYFKSYLKEVL